uniref:Uncharacterized protein n=1 Tax=Arundo donax TaxID=35708 RepID=A0A0A9AQ95_ARUDO
MAADSAVSPIRVSRPSATLHLSMAELSTFPRATSTHTPHSSASIFTL